MRLARVHASERKCNKIRKTVHMQFAIDAHADDAIVSRITRHTRDKDGEQMLHLSQ